MDETQQPVQQTPESELPSQQLTTSPTQSRNWYKIILFCLLGIVVLMVAGFILLIKFYGWDDTKSWKTDYSNIPTNSQSMPTPLPIDNTNIVVSGLPDWAYEAFADCNVSFPIPPKKEPYYSTPNPSKPPSVTNDEGSGRFWDFPRGATYPNLLSKLLNGSDNYKQGSTMYASPEEASGYVSSAVTVFCTPNDNHLNTLSMLDTLKVKLKEHNADTGKSAMLPSSYTIKSATEVNRWNQKVYDLAISEDYSNSGGAIVNAEYTMFTTPHFIYEVKVYGETNNKFVKETRKQIFDNLRFASN